ncbi:ras gtpase [Anaeramoeba ignava]|uniref:Ras gtpase n=1 Tax=Anaeramoeba ignava TaxID=1746090 RepID=A0A9Q0LBF4_ANAIG|nr:ras gtpase [Anaeramoeba ignava]
MNKKKNWNDYLELRIAIFGKEGVGKTSITKRFLKGRFIDYYDPSMDEDSKKMDINNEKIHLWIFDTAGQEEYQILNERIARKCYSFVLVYSIDDRNSFQEIIEIHKKNQQFLENEDYPKVLIGNKNDLFTKREVKTKEGKELAKQLNCKFIETSAKNGENINQLFYESSILAIPKAKAKRKKKELKKQKEKKKGNCLLM